jgi:3-(3-hydroxy-phenyl)propionate hydroxylase
VLVFGHLSATALQRLRQVHNRSGALRAGAGPGRAAQARNMCATPKVICRAACHVFGHAWALIRPDGYLAATGEVVDGDLVQAVEKSWVCKPPRTQENTR